MKAEAVCSWISIHDAYPDGVVSSSLLTAVQLLSQSQVHCHMTRRSSRS
jgi:hypothetical protein